MIEFGKTLSEAREAAGLTIGQLAEKTHMLPQVVENMEREDFSRIVAPIYGRGFVKLYCEAVGIDAKPLVEEFMEIYNGNREPTIRIRQVESAAEPPATAETSPAPSPEEMEPTTEAVPEPPVYTVPPPAAWKPEPADDLFSQPAPEPIHEPPPPSAADIFASLPTSANDDEPTPHAATKRRDYRLPGHSMPTVPTSFWRFGLLALAAIAIIAALVFGARALYRATMTTPVDEPEEAVPTERTAPAETPKSPAEASAPAEPRTPQKIPTLYID